MLNPANDTELDILATTTTIGVLLTRDSACLEVYVIRGMELSLIPISNATDNPEIESKMLTEVVAPSLAEILSGVAVCISYTPLLPGKTSRESTVAISVPRLGLGLG